MKHAFLITVYKNPCQLLQLIDSLNSESSVFFIHVDRKSKSFMDDPCSAKLSGRDNVFFAKDRIDVKWGGFSHLQAIVALLKESRNYSNFDFYHSLTGQDFPIKPISYILDYFLKNGNSEFIEFRNLPTEKWPNGGIDRLEFMHFNDYFNPKKKMFKTLNSFLLKFQEKINYKRTFILGFPQLYGGSTWWSLSGVCVNYILNYLNNNKWYYNRFKFSHCAEEIFFQTIIANSPLKDRVVNDNLRYIDWVFRNGNSPANLDLSDFDNLMKSKKLFARKFEGKIGQELLDKLKKYTGF
ncbi:beta-1,6-N-acetylglucosaminyltransferase [Nibribacter koreensis]|uniref:Peptide O-xylosyltransferase n=1 Tax=Nibribacter koreensis TaxID=1084519 RepID=A0ABP8FHP6_9BACT